MFEKEKEKVSAKKSAVPTLPVAEGEVVAPEPKEPKVKKVKTGICEFCGAVTRGGLFCPGHDSKMKSANFKIYRDLNSTDEQRAAALAILTKKGWVHPTWGAEEDAKRAALIAKKNAPKEVAVEAKTA
jgi:hypothetical protein